MLSTETGLAAVARQMAEALESCQNTLDDAAPRYETGAERCPFCGSTEWSWSRKLWGNRLVHLDDCPREAAMIRAGAALRAWDALEAEEKEGA